MTYRPDPITQRDGSELADSNCRMAAGASGIDFDTLGRVTSTGAKMRDRSGDPSGGTTSDDIARAWDSYGETIRVRDGRTWADAEAELREGRLVHIDVWAATTAGPCVSGSGGYGHTMAIAPESRDDDWLVSDPWCSPPKWTWWPASKLRKGAEEWADRCGARSAESGGPRDIRELARARLLELVRELMSLWNPAHPLEPELDRYVPGTGGGSAPIMYTSTAAHPGGTDMAIDTFTALTTGKLARLTEGTPWFADSELTDQRGKIPSDREAVYIGNVLDGPSRAVVLSTAEWSDGESYEPVIVYVDRDAIDPYDAEPGPVPGPDPDARDAEWRAWLESDAHAPDR